MAEFVKNGDVVDYTPSSDVTAGDVIVQLDLVGVAFNDIAADELGALKVEGVIAFDKAVGGGTSIPAGTKCYWDAADKEAKADDETGANKFIGKSVLVAGDDDEQVQIRMEQ